MTIQPTAAPPTRTEPLDARTAALLLLAQQNQAERAALISATLTAVLGVWAQMEMASLFASWWRGALGARIFVLLSASQEVTANQSSGFVTESFRLLGQEPRPIGLVPSTFSGIASDGRDLEGLLTGAPVLALQRIRRGDTPAAASKTGADYLRKVVTTQIADAGRAADQVAITSAIPAQPRKRGKRQVRYGWVRMLNPPSCSRCIILAGRFYRWNEGFARHEMCDCAHIPAIEEVENDITTDPKAYFESLSTEEQNEIFGKANATAIRQGADMNAVINATRRGGVRTADDGRVYTLEGTSRRGFYGRAANGVRRPTPWQIYRDAAGDVEEARKMLRRFRYIIG